MTRCLRVLLCALWPALALAVAAQKAVPSHHTLWKVEGPSNTVYLLGSIHLLKKTDYPLPSVIQSAFSNSQVVAFETDIGQANNAAPKMLAQFVLPAGETLQDEITPATYRALSNYLAAADLPISIVSQYKPAFAAFLMDSVESQKLGLDPAYGLDEYLYKHAKEDGKKIIALEPVDFQIKLLTGFSKKEGELILQGTLDDVRNTETDFDVLLGAWKSGDAARLQKMLTKAFDDSPEIYRRLVTDRTARWLPQVEHLLSGGQTALVVVGAGHLVGPGGLVELLQKKGFKITQWGGKEFA